MNRHQLRLSRGWRRVRAVEDAPARSAPLTLRRVPRARARKLPFPNSKPFPENFPVMSSSVPGTSFEATQGWLNQVARTCPLVVADFDA